MLDFGLFDLAGNLLSDLSDRDKGQVTVPLNDGRRGQVTIPLEHKAAGLVRPLSTVLRAWWYGKPVLASPVTIPRFLPEQGQVEINATDPSFRLQRSYVGQRVDGGVLGYQAAVDQSEIMARLIDHVQTCGASSAASRFAADSGAWPVPVQRGSIPITTARYRAYEPGKQVWEAIRELSEVQGGVDFELEPVDVGAAIPLTNPGAESGSLTGWTAGGSGTWYVVSDRARSGSYSFAVVNGSLSDSYRYQDVTLQPGLYMAEVWLQGSGISGGSAGINIDGLTGAAHWIADDVGYSGSFGFAPSEWYPARAFVSVRTAGTFRIYLQLGYFANTTGTAWFDDVTVRPIALCKLNTFSRQGSDKSAAVRFTSGFAWENCSIVYEPAGDGVVNVGTKQGQSEEGQVPASYTSRQPGSLRSYGAYGSFEGLPDVSLAGTLAEHAQGQVSGAAFPVDFFDLIPAVEGRGYTRDASGLIVPVPDRSYGQAPRFGPGTGFDYWVGDTITVHARHPNGIDGEFSGRVTDATISDVEDTGDQVVQLTVGPDIPAVSVT